MKSQVRLQFLFSQQLLFQHQTSEEKKKEKRGKQVERISCQEAMGRLIQLLTMKGILFKQIFINARGKRNPSLLFSSPIARLVKLHIDYVRVCVFMGQHTQNIRINICLSSSIVFECKRRRIFSAFLNIFDEGRATKQTLILSRLEVHQYPRSMIE